MRPIIRLFQAFGFSPVQFFKALKGLPTFLAHLVKFIYRFREPDFKLALYPCLSDRYEGGGTAKGHYYHQDLLVAREIFRTNPNRHIDIGSRFDGFVTHVASFRIIEVIDIRPLDLKDPQIVTKRVDFMSELPADLYAYTDSCSCLHALEHFGLGRYGDNLITDGHLRGLENLYNILKPSGTLYLSVPIGANRIDFNAHRVFSLEYLISIFDTRFVVEKFSYVDDEGNLHENIDIQNLIDNNFSCHYGCGIFKLIKQ